MEEEGLSRSTKIVIAAVLAVAVVIVIALGLWWLQLRRTAAARSQALPTPASGAVVAVTVLPTVTAAPPVPTPVPPTATPAPPTPPPTSTPVPASALLGYHTVRYGETLFCIGRAYAVAPQAIALQNGLGYPYRVQIGQQLAIPNVPWRYVPAGPTCARQFDGGAPLPPPTCRVTYMVLLGDTLYAIAGRYQSSVWAIVSANSIPNPNLIFPGQVLCIP